MQRRMLPRWRWLIGLFGHAPARSRRWLRSLELDTWQPWRSNRIVLTAAARLSLGLSLLSVAWAHETKATLTESLLVSDVAVVLALPCGSVDDGESRRETTAASCSGRSSWAATSTAFVTGKEAS
jgi:hypothetical protein